MSAQVSQSLSPSSLSDAADDDQGDKNAHLVGAAAALAAAEFLNQHHAQANSTVAHSSPTTPDLTRTESSRTTTAGSTPQFPASQIQFRSHTIAPSPPPGRPSSTSATPQKPSQASTDPITQLPHHPAPLGGNTLRLQTDIHPVTPINADNSSLFATPSTRPTLTLQHKTSTSSLKVSRTPSFKAGVLSHAFGPSSAASSTVSSPIITAMGDVTPLPSPLLSSDSPGPWRKLGKRSSRDAPSFPPMAADSALVTSAGESIASAIANHNKRKAYAGLASGSGPAIDDVAAGEQDGARGKAPAHTRQRSISEYVPDPMLVPRRMMTVSGSHAKPELKKIESAFESHMRREPHLSQTRGLTPIEQPPTPPPSESSSVNGSGASIRSTKSSSRPEYFEAYGRHDRKKRRWRAIKMLGQGTFSRVMLATSQISSSPSDDEEYASTTSSGLLTPEPVPRYDRRALVAVKVCEHGPRGGASEDRIEMSLKRELEIMQSIHHPSLVHLKAWNIEPTRAILVLSYCPGGDLFDVASAHRDMLSPALLRRMFAELVGAVGYLHERRIVHRDIKLENVLVNLTPAELCSSTTDWATYPYSVITLTDLGLSRRVADDEKLETRCGSDDYAAPEVIMGQSYDGRATDAWSLGVLLYALLETRLPFDPHPGVGDQAMQMRMRSRTSHRIARVEWRWIEYGAREGEEGEGDHEADLARFDAKGLRGAMEVVEGLLKRSRTRWPLSKVAATAWVSGGIQVEGGIKFREEEEGEEVLSH
ncbi:kinase-like domain-containing protein [Diplogelasinospora grovesii]|uniref:Kinase-like domain-containing protein n=1 Tax=Diplogelasinospora grovesii TaxID=303347 RepID=A0AAN6N805_9PEZI|nr:kinase-like domain-containing protein [Diplogelasinospora grovesii]